MPCGDSGVSYPPDGAKLKNCGWHVSTQPLAHHKHEFSISPMSGLHCMSYITRNALPSAKSSSTRRARRFAGSSFSGHQVEFSDGSVV